ncbi:MAG: hypothetical protein K2I42_01740 [Anaeroplasmataceae bacterium]|nr:hypothetical protein [Anaeroplasmataceae bacterium]
MFSIKNAYSKLNMQVLKITEKKYFNEIYSALLSIITIFGWKFNNTLGMILMIITAMFILILTKDLKFVIPNTIYFIFIISTGFSNNQIPIPIIVLGIGYAVVLLLFSFKDGFRFNKMRSLYGLLGMAIVNIIPIFWCKMVKPGNEVYYFLYFGNLGYLLLYIIMVNGIKQDGIRLVATTMSYLAVILAFECGFKVWELKDTVESILQLAYYLGWGLCNEAGIMICVSIPFIFYLLGTEEKIGGMLYQHAKLLVGVLGLILTTSRGSYLFGFLEIGILYVVLLFTAKNAKVYQNLFLIFGLIIITLAFCYKDQVIKVASHIHHLVFTQGLDDNGRKELWIEGYSQWNKNLMTKIFGAGMVCYLKESTTAVGWMEAPVVFHSTIMETLTAGGILGFVFLLLHLYQKYRNLKKCDGLFFITIGVGYIIVDLYGLIDNTYHMYYFMLPMAVIFATIDSSITIKDKSNLLF